MLYSIAKLPPETQARIRADYMTRTTSMWHTLPRAMLGTSAKIEKSRGVGVLGAIMYLAPADAATPRGTTLCPYADKAGCKAGCLNTAGRGRYDITQLSRIRKTLAIQQYESQAHAILDADIVRHAFKARALGLVPAIRLNGTSDLDFTPVIARHPDVQFYDYTKVFTRVDRPIPDNYHLTLSYSEANPGYAKNILARVWDHGGTVQPKANAAVVFRDAETVAKVRQHGWKGFTPDKIIDGDTHDARFLDSGPGYIVALTAKGKAKQDQSGFVVDVTP